MGSGIKNISTASKDIRKNFPCKIQTTEQTIFDESYKVSYKQYIVTVNGFIIAHFLSEKSMLCYLETLKIIGFNHFPKSVIDIFEKQSHFEGNLKSI
jgi:hypothetical protein